MKATASKYLDSNKNENRWKNINIDKNNFKVFYPNLCFQTVNEKKPPKPTPPPRKLCNIPAAKAPSNLFFELTIDNEEEKENVDIESNVIITKPIYRPIPPPRPSLSAKIESSNLTNDETENILSNVTTSTDIIVNGEIYYPLIPKSHNPYSTNVPIKVESKISLESKAKIEAGKLQPKMMNLSPPTPSPHSNVPSKLSMSSKLEGQKMVKNVIKQIDVDDVERWKNIKIGKPLIFIPNLSFYQSPTTNFYLEEPPIWHINKSEKLQRMPPQKIPISNRLKNCNLKKKEIHPDIFHPKYKTELCKRTLNGGRCYFGNACNFLHPGEIVPFRKL